MIAAREMPETKKSRQGALHELKRHKILYLMCIPGLIILIMFCYVPFAGIWMAFTDFNVVDGIFGSKFVGLDNFKYFFSSSMGWKVTYNTLVINFFGIVLGIIFPITIAVLLNEIRGKAFKKLTQSMMFFPYFISWVVVGAIIYGIFSTDVGVANGVLAWFGIDPIRWYSEPKYWKEIIILANVWKWSGYNSIIYLAAMSSFDGSLYEAAKVDGANRLQQIMRLTIPMLKPTVIVLTLLSVGRIFYGDFGMIYGIVGNNPVLIDEVTVIDTYVYQSMRTLGFSYSTAIGLFQSVMGLILITLANGVAKKVNDGEGLF
ncbi:multiple sugar transport system permease protein/putative aldouronate transport system permease protein [Cohnella sp. SGD-V74]|jgi:ABC-type polysaccharide transport system, permease component|uniref:ABC transporter permease n=1 Tax=unclassified Cohnella TaxID=2636738 RepID=UPI000D4C809E|nr:MULTISPECIES: ABC transporter permease subunit [unclassified Cohnella]PRX61119.1 multiple sugar transport system permease protein/putative aldouronate transport system permease protein [Cohnella sp. SGD-V74]